MPVSEFGRLPDGSPIFQIRLQSGAVRASVLTFGATLQDLQVPLPGGGLRRVVLGYPTLAGYLADTNYIGVTAGRFASRIGDGRLRIDGQDHQLSLNAGRHHLHGGAQPFSARPWTLRAADETTAVLGLVSPDGDQGYPGTLDVRCTYRLLPPATLRVTMTATTDAPTVVNLAHHSYFALTPGTGAREHALQVNARHSTPLGPDAVPTGEIRAVAGTDADFRQLRRIGGSQPAEAEGYDVIFVIDRGDAGLCRAATLVAPDGALAMQVHSTEPCLIFYDGRFIASDLAGHDDTRHGRHAGLCLEPILFPDSPNNPWFPQAILRPCGRYHQVTEYRFEAPPP